MKKPTNLLSDKSWSRLQKVLEKACRRRAMEYSADDIKRGGALVVYRYSEALCALPRGLPDAELTLRIGEVGSVLCASLTREGEYEQRRDANLYMNALIYGRDQHEFEAALNEALHDAGRDDIVRVLAKGIGLA